MFAQKTWAENQSDPTDIISVTDRSDNNWGIAIGIRRGDIPYAVKDDLVYDTLPLIYYKNEYLYVRGMEAGGHIWKNQHHQVNFYTRFRFVDIPKSLQNESQAQAFDFGLQYRFIKDEWEADLALLSDTNKRWYGYTRTQYHGLLNDNNDWELVPFIEFKWKSADFNQYYYGLNQYDVAGGVSVNGGIKAKYHLISNLYLLGQLGINRLEDEVYRLPTIDRHYQYESFLGVGFFPEPISHSTTDKKSNDEYWRFSHGWATPSNLNEMLRLHTRTDPYNNQFSSLFYGTRVSKSLFTLPIELYLTPGAVWHHDSKVQDNLAEIVLAIKAYYTFSFGPRWRFGVAEGLSYASTVTHIEQSELDKKGYESSRLLNYLDFSLDVNIGDLFNTHQLNKMWLGYSIHHRSGIFETSSAFGRIGGGSNYQSLYLQWHF